METSFLLSWFEMVKHQHNYKVPKFCLSAHCRQLSVHLLAVSSWFPRKLHVPLPVNN